MKSLGNETEGLLSDKPSDKVTIFLSSQVELMGESGNVSKVGQVLPPAGYARCYLSNTGCPHPAWVPEN